jgi:hypothetical protein
MLTIKDPVWCWFLSRPDTVLPEAEEVVQVGADVAAEEGHRVDLLQEAGLLLAVARLLGAV